jgi:hypothetical protein
METSLWGCKNFHFRCLNWLLNIILISRNCSPSCKLDHLIDQLLLHWAWSHSAHRDQLLLHGHGVIHLIETNYYYMGMESFISFQTFATFSNWKQTVKTVENWPQTTIWPHCENWRKCLKHQAYLFTIPILTNWKLLCSCIYKFSIKQLISWHGFMLTTVWKNIKRI